MYLNSKKGFTLIELLVVISIISLLSAVVLTTLGNARIKAKDTAIKQEVGELQKVIEQSFLNGYKSNYGDTGLLVGFVKKDCSNLGGDMASEAQKICAAIYKTGGLGDFGGYGSETNAFSIRVLEYTNSSDWLPFKGVRYDMYSITVLLNSGNYYCVSNLGIYEGITNPWGSYGTHPPCVYYLTP